MADERAALGKNEAKRDEEQKKEREREKVKEEESDGSPEGQSLSDCHAEV